MTRAEIEEKFFRVAHREVEPLEIALTDHFTDDWGIDSIEKLALLLGTEEAFEIDITDEEWADTHTVQQAVDLIIRHVGGK